MSDSRANTPSCAFIPVYCYNDPVRGEIKTPILIAEKDSLLSAIILPIDPDVFTAEELKEQFIDAYYQKMSLSSANRGLLHSYDIYPQLVSILNTGDDEISVYVCELYENTTSYFKKAGIVTELLTYTKGVDELIQGGALESLTKKLLMTLSEREYIALDDDDIGISSIFNP